jgi:hypothetical protein
MTFPCAVARLTAAFARPLIARGSGRKVRKDYKSVLPLMSQLPREAVKHRLSNLYIDLLTLCDRVWQRPITA